MVQQRRIGNGLHRQTEGLSGAASRLASPGCRADGLNREVEGAAEVGRALQLHSLKFTAAETQVALSIGLQGGAAGIAEAEGG